MGHELGKGLEEVAEMSMPELEIWLAYFKINADAEKDAMNKGKAR